MRSHHSAFQLGAVVFLSLLVAVALTACGAPKPQGMIYEIEGARINEHELRARVTEFAREVMGHMKARSYQVYDSAKDSRSRRNALLAAIRVNQMTIDAATHSDPVIALADLWALIVQMRNFFESDRAGELGADEDGVILFEIDALEEKVIAIADDLGGPSFVANVQDKIETWAQDHPIAGDFYRPSVGPVFAASFKETTKGMFSMAQTLDDRLAGISARLESLTDQLPQQITWHAALLIEDLIGDLDIEEMADQTERILTMVEQTPQAIEAQRDAVLEEINRQRTDTLGVVDTQRDLILEDLDRQRTETLAEFQTMVDGTLSKVLEVRDVTFARIDTTLVSTLDRLDGESESLVADIDAKILVAIDRVFRRFLLIVGLALAGSAAIARWARHRRPALR